jgi:signal transduction histidine kinase
VAGVLVWVTVLALRLEAGEARALEDARFQESVRLALWRMDSWLGPLLASEAARPYFEYQPYYPQNRAYTRVLSQIRPGEVLTPSPLLTFRSEFFPLHFQVDGAAVTSPQVPEGSQQELAESTLLPTERLGENGAVLEHVRTLWRPETAAARVNLIEGCVTSAEPRQWQQAQQRGQVALPAQQLDQQAQVAMTQEEFSQRFTNYRDQQIKNADANVNANEAAQPPLPEQAVQLGPLVPVWLAPGELAFVRRVQMGKRMLHQGLLVDWPRLRDALVGRARDLLPGASLRPAAEAALTEHHGGRRLATVPAELDAPPPVPAPIPFLTPTRITLGLAWLGVLAAIVAVGFTLRSSIDFGERRSRFASAVTHELRTPLTTFRLYSEMLADGLVRDPEKREVYFRTLKDESTRLATLVENVLAYARLEEGRLPRRRERLPADALVARSLPALERRAADAGLRIETALGDGAGALVVDVDPEAVGQVLFNLVDNACKYAAGEGRPGAIRLEVAERGGEVALSVRDQGPGIGEGAARRLFVPFDRGDRGPGDTIPGVGLGLALSRGLARDQGGDLALVRDGAPGACFVLTLPKA